MSNIKLDLYVCCLKCKHIEIKETIDHMYAGNEIINSFGSISCAHAKTCKFISEQETISTILNQLNVS